MRIPSTVPCLIASALLFSLQTTALAQTNSRTNSASGNWQDSYWSLGVLPGTNQTILLTNTGWKAVAIGSQTATDFPKTLTVGSVTISSPTNSFNSLLLNYAGVGSPLIAGSVRLNENSAITLYSSGLKVTNMSVGGIFDQDYFSGVSAGTLQIGDIGPGTYTMSNGTLTVTAHEVLGGWGYPAVFDQEGGYHSATSLSINAGGEYDLRGGQFGGAVTMAGGTLAQSAGDLALGAFDVDGFYNLLGGTLEAPAGLTVYQGHVTQTGGTNSSGSLYIGSINPFNLGQGFYTVSNGVLNVSNATVSPGGNLDQEGGIIAAAGALNMQYFWTGSNPGIPITGIFTLNGGMFSAGSIALSGSIVQNGGTNTVAGDLAAQVYPASYTLTGGLLSTSNTSIGISGIPFTQSGGVHLVQNLLSIDTSLNYTMSGGWLVAPSIEIGGSSFIHIGGTISNSVALILDTGNWTEETTNAQLGSLQLGQGTSEFCTLTLPSGPWTMHFLDSSGETWPTHAIFHITNWSGSLYGGGKQQIVFGSNSAALTTQQLNEAQFQNPAGLARGWYPARILATGEIVPDTGAPLPLKLEVGGALSNGAMPLQVQGEIGQNYEVDVSTDLVDWTSWTTVSNSSGTISLSDSEATDFPQRFYRVRLVP